jgi:hypothetical protein
MVDDVLSSIDLNPIIATLGQEVSDIVDDVTGVVGGGSGSASSSSSSSASGSTATATATTKRSEHDSRSYPLEHNVLYSLNDYQGRTHTNRVLAQNGSLYDEFLDNDGNEQGRAVVGYYATDMVFNHHNRTVEVDGQGKQFELQYLYAPFPGVEVTSWIYVDATGGKVKRTQVIAEAHGGGTSTISNDSGL